MTLGRTSTNGFVTRIKILIWMMHQMDQIASPTLESFISLEYQESKQASTQILRTPRRLTEHLTTVAYIPANAPHYINKPGMETIRPSEYSTGKQEMMHSCKSTRGTSTRMQEVRAPARQPRMLALATSSKKSSMKNYMKYFPGLEE